MSDIVFQEERSGVVLIERESGRREWYWAREIPDAEAADLNKAKPDYGECGGCGVDWSEWDTDDRINHAREHAGE